METWQLGYGGPFGGKLVEGTGVICGKLRKVMLCGATGWTGTGRNGRVKLTLKTLG